MAESWQNDVDAVMSISDDAYVSDRSTDVGDAFDGNQASSRRRTFRRRKLAQFRGTTGKRVPTQQAVDALAIEAADLVELCEKKFDNRDPPVGDQSEVLAHDRCLADWSKRPKRQKGRGKSGGRRSRTGFTRWQGYGDGKKAARRQLLGQWRLREYARFLKEAAFGRVPENDHND